jgi:hypothetical protein
MKIIAQKVGNTTTNQSTHTLALGKTHVFRHLGSTTHPTHTHTHTPHTPHPSHPHVHTRTPHICCRLTGDLLICQCFGTDAWSVHVDVFWFDANVLQCWCVTCTMLPRVSFLEVAKKSLALWITQKSLKNYSWLSKIPHSLWPRHHSHHYHQRCTSVTQKLAHSRKANMLDGRARSKVTE